MQITAQERKTLLFEAFHAKDSITLVISPIGNDFSREERALLFSSIVEASAITGTAYLRCDVDWTALTNGSGPLMLEVHLKQAGRCRSARKALIEHARQLFSRNGWAPID